MNDSDRFYMQLALAQAAQAVGLSSPNPRVGCVLVRDGQILGQGHTQAAGQAHAEVMAIRSAQGDLRGCTVYVTLEPCCHFGRTPPCVAALQAIAPARVVVALLDANPQVAGQGVAQLRAAGIVVDVLAADTPLAQQAFELNIGFMQRMRDQRVFTRLKWAATLDGKTALPDGRSQWITGAAARHDGHTFRARADVIVTGIGTVLRDNPQLSVRGVHVAHPPIKCVLDSTARLPLNARLFDDGAPVWLVCAPDAATVHRAEAVQAQHAQLTVLHATLPELWAHFAAAQFNEIHVEAGARLNGALLRAGLVDELLMYVAPRVLGNGLPAAQWGESLDDLRGHGAWHWLDAQRVGDDMRLRARRK
ncbi:MAG: bifunctional diaminohydroxyphosphoribosylaminopyrimidine deaminase/5-amino-6-(5-phosphoribosylamino)uracil reductase RibD [Formosimonas sp.]